MRSSKSILLIAMIAASAVTAGEIFNKNAFLQEVSDAAGVPSNVQNLDFTYNCLYTRGNDAFNLVPLG